jgi:hypothetical protein
MSKLEHPMADSLHTTVLNHSGVSNGSPAPDTDPPTRTLTPAAQRALAEAAERRAAHDAKIAKNPKEIGGPAGPEPVRYGDWEKGGIAWDF